MYVFTKCLIDGYLSWKSVYSKCIQNMFVRFQSLSSFQDWLSSRMFQNQVRVELFNVLSLWVLTFASVHISAGSKLVLVCSFLQVNNSLSGFPKWSVQTVVCFNYIFQFRSCYSLQYQAPSQPWSCSQQSRSSIESELLEIRSGQRNSSVCLK